MNFGPGGNFPAAGAQYVLEVVPGRADQVLLYQINSNPFDLSSADFTIIGNGFPFTVNSFVPNSSSRTFTVSASKP
jgi:hypothetical protein